MIGETLKKLRTESHLSQWDLGNKLGVSQQAIGQWEKGTREPDSNTIKRIANLFHVTTDFLMGNAEAETNNLREVMAVDKKTALKFIQKLMEDTESKKITWKRYSETFEPLPKINSTLSFYASVASGYAILYYEESNSVNLNIQFSREDEHTEISVPYDPEIQRSINELYNLVYGKLPSLESFFEKYLSSKN